ncbi:MAG: hypothetical protein ACOC5R_02345 [Elusimicrobiota bacterium]
MKRLIILLALVFLFLPNLYADDDEYEDNREVYVMPNRYAYVLADSGDVGWESQFGSADKWDRIILWGRCPESYANAGYEYRWFYGETDSNGDEYKQEDWETIEGATLGNVKGTHLYLNANYNDTDYPNGFTGYKMENEDVPMTFRNAVLKIRDDDGDIIAEKRVIVKVVNFENFNTANGFGNEDERTEAKRLIVESMAKGRGLTYLYRELWKKFIGNTEDIRYIHVPLTAFVVHGHTVYDPEGIIDIYYEFVNECIRQILERAEVINVVDQNKAPTWGSDINNNNVMISFDEYTSRKTYNHGITMLALAAAKNQNRETQTLDELFPGLDIPGYDEEDSTYIDVLEDLVDWAAWAQNDQKGNNPDWFTGGWRYWENYYDNVSDSEASDLSCVQWPVLGLVALEDLWGIRAPDFVREKLIYHIRCVQEQDPNSNVNGGTVYEAYHNYTVPYDTKVNLTNIASYHEYPSFDHRWLVGTNSLLQCLFYLSMDETGHSPPQWEGISNNHMDYICGCGSNNCAQTGNNYETDFKLYGNDFAGSCERVKHAINFIARNDITPESGGGYDWYTMYGIMKALRLYNYERGGINNGILYGNGDCFGARSGEEKQWEDKYSNCVIDKLKTNGEIIGGRWNSGNDFVQTGFAMLLLADTVYGISSIKTEKDIEKRMGYNWGR